MEYSLIEHLTKEDLIQIDKLKNEIDVLTEDIKNSKDILSDDGLLEDLILHRNTLIELLHDNSFMGE